MEMQLRKCMIMMCKRTVLPLNYPLASYSLPKRSSTHGPFGKLDYGFITATIEISLRSLCQAIYHANQKNMTISPTVPSPRHAHPSPRWWHYTAR